MQRGKKDRIRRFPAGIYVRSSTRRSRSGPPPVSSYLRSILLPFEKSRNKTSEGNERFKKFKITTPRIYGSTVFLLEIGSLPVMKFAKSSARVPRARKSHHAVDLSQFPFAHEFNLFARPAPRFNRARIDPGNPLLLSPDLSSQEDPRTPPSSLGAFEKSNPRSNRPTNRPIDVAES